MNHIFLIQYMRADKHLFFIILVFMTVGSHSQAFKEFELGAQLGLNGSSLSTTNINNSNLLISYNAGISGEYYFSDDWGLKLKVIYDKKGWSYLYNPNDNFNTEEGDIIFNYVTLPIMAGFHFGYHKEWYVNFGLYTGFLLSVNDSESASASDSSEGYKDVDFGGAVGIGYKFEIERNLKFFLEIQGQSSFLGIYDDNDAEYYTITRSSINAGILFHIR